MLNSFVVSSMKKVLNSAFLAQILVLYATIWFCEPWITGRGCEKHLDNTSACTPSPSEKSYSVSRNPIYNLFTELAPVQNGKRPLWDSNKTSHIHNQLSISPVQISRGKEKPLDNV